LAVTPEAAKLIRVAEEYKGIAQVKHGNYLLDIAGAIQDHVEANGFSMVEDFTRSRSQPARGTFGLQLPHP